MPLLHMCQSLDLMKKPKTLLQKQKTVKTHNHKLIDHDYLTNLIH
jgi:hypothetical protein